MKGFLCILGLLVPWIGLSATWKLASEGWPACALIVFCFTVGAYAGIYRQTVGQEAEKTD